MALFQTVCVIAAVIWATWWLTMQSLKKWVAGGSKRSQALLLLLRHVILCVLAVTIITMVTAGTNAMAQRDPFDFCIALALIVLVVSFFSILCGIESAMRAIAKS